MKRAAGGWRPSQPSQAGRTDAVLPALPSSIAGSFTLNFYPFVLMFTRNSSRNFKFNQFFFCLFIFLSFLTTIFLSPFNCFKDCICQYTAEPRTEGSRVSGDAGKRTHHQTTRRGLTTPRTRVKTCLPHVLSGFLTVFPYRVFPTA